MSEEKIEPADAAPSISVAQLAAALPGRKGKRRNCMVIPGTSDPNVAKVESQALIKEIFGPKQEIDHDNPEHTK